MIASCKTALLALLALAALATAGNAAKLVDGVYTVQLASTSCYL